VCVCVCVCLCPVQLRDGLSLQDVSCITNGNGISQPTIERDVFTR